MGATVAILRLDIDGAALRGFFMPTSTLTKWGNSQGIILPKTVCDELRLKVGDTLELEVVDGELRARPA